MTQRASEFAPWNTIGPAAPGPARADGPQNQKRLAGLRARGYQVDPSCFVASEAVVDADNFHLGADSYLAAQTHVTGEVQIGNNCSVNVFTAIRGDVRIGDGVRIGASCSVLGFNHVFTDPHVPVRLQGIDSRGIVIAEDVWIGAHVLVLDGVKIGAHSVIGAGAVVTKDIPDYSVAVGNPARIIRNRLDPANKSAEGPAALAALLGKRLRDQVPGLLRSAWDSGHGAFTDSTQVAPTIRAACDAVELAALLGADISDFLPTPKAKDRLFQTIGTAVPEQYTGRWNSEHDYHVLCTGYALRLLGQQVPTSITDWADQLSPTGATDLLAGPDWANNAWHGGSLADTIGTSLTWALLQESNGNQTATVQEAVLGWLLTHRNPETGLWGGKAGTSLREPVNGAYRLVRGTFAQWGIPLGGGDRVTDAVLRHVRDGALEHPTACDALDVVYLLWWAAKENPDYRAAEVRVTASRVLQLSLDAWKVDRGAAFAPWGTEMTICSGADPTEPSLQGTEMWFALAWYAADLLGVSSYLGYRPAGIHNPDPTWHAEGTSD